MRKSFAAFAFAALALAQPASAITFSTLTTIYVGGGVQDVGEHNAGVATIFQCTNVSGNSSRLRVVLLYEGVIAGSTTFPQLPHGTAVTIATHLTLAYSEDTTFVAGDVFNGVINIEATESAVFCSAKLVNAADTTIGGIIVPLVRVNPHPGTVE